MGCPDPMPRYRRFFEPPVGARARRTSTRRARAYVRAALGALTAVDGGGAGGRADRRGVLGRRGQHVGVAARAPCRGGARPRSRRLSARSRSTSAAAPTRRRPRTWRARWASRRTWERVDGARERSTTCARPSRTIEDYHPLDVECAAAALCLLRGIRERHPSLRYLVDGDGGDENLKAYPLEDSDLTLSSMLRNPLLYQEGLGHRRHQAQPRSIRAGCRAATCARSRRRPATASRRSRRTRAARSIAAAVAMPFEHGAGRRSRRG